MYFFCIYIDYYRFQKYIEQNHTKEWEQHLNYLQKEANGHKEQSVTNSNFKLQLLQMFFHQKLLLNPRLKEKFIKNKNLGTNLNN